MTTVRPAAAQASAVLSALLWMLVVRPPFAAGGGVRDLDDAWLVSPAVLGALFAMPSASDHRWCVSAGHGRLFGLPELPQVGLELTYAAKGGEATVSWQQLGADLYRERIWRVHLRVGANWRIGARCGQSQLDLSGGPARRQFDADLYAQVPLAADASLEVWWPLTPLPVWYGESGLRRWFEVTGRGDHWLWVLATDRNADGKPSAQGEVLLRLGPPAAIGLRCEPASGCVGLCTAWSAAGVVLRSSHVLHPDLGLTHRWGLVAVGR